MMKLEKCCAKHEWPVWGSCAAAMGSIVKGRNGPEADPTPSHRKKIWHGHLTWRTV